MTLVETLTNLQEKNLHGTVSGAVLTSDRHGNVNSAYEFDGESDYISFGDSTYFKFDSTFSISIWAMPTGTSDGILFNKEGEYEMAKRTNSNINWAVANTNPGWVWVDVQDSLKMNEWTHVVFTYDLGTAKTYFNGTLIHTHNGTGPVGDKHNESNSLRIGGRELGSQFFQGKLDDFQLFDKTLSATEVAQLYEQ